MTDGIPEQNDPSYALLVGGFHAGDNFFTNTGTVNENLGGIMPFAVDTTGHVYTHSAIDQAAVEATVTYPGAEHSAQIWGVSLMGAIVTESTIGGQTYTDIEYQPLNLSSGGLLLTSAAFAGSTGSTVPTTAAFIAGTDGTNLRGLSVSSAGVLNVSDGTAHTGLASILTQLDLFQFDGSGNLKVNVEAGGSSNPSVGPTGSAVPADATAMGGQDRVTGSLVIPLVSSAGDVPGGGILLTADQWNQQVAQIDAVTADYYIYTVGGWRPDNSTFQIFQVNAAGELLVSSSGAASGPTPIAGTLGSRNPALLSTPGGLLRVQVDELPELDINFPDPSEYIDQDLSLAVAQPRFPAPPNSLQITTSMTPLVMPAVGNGITNISRPLWDEPGAASSSGNLPIGAYYSANTSPNATAFQVPLVAHGAGMCVAVTVYNLSGSQWANSCAIRLRNNSNGITANWQITPLLAGAASSTPWVGAVTLYFNMPVSTNDSLSIDVLAASTLAGFAMAAVVVPQPMPVQLRYDGRSMPGGSQGAVVNANGTGLSTIVAAPGAGFRLLVQGLFVSIADVSASMAYCEVTWTLNGNAGAGFLNWIANGDRAGSATYSPEQGVLLDPNTAITAECGASTTSTTLTVNYDIVPA